jgi:hypothetical protein
MNLPPVCFYHIVNRLIYPVAFSQSNCSLPLHRYKTLIVTAFMYSAPPPSVGSVDTTSTQPQTNTRSTVFPLQNLRSSLPEPDVASYWKSVKNIILRYLHLLWFTLKRVAEYLELNYAPIPKALSTNSLYRILARQFLSYESLSHERVLDHITDATSAGSCDLPETVLHVLKSLSVGDIWISQDQHNPLTNRVKEWIENTTKVA